MILDEPQKESAVNQRYQQQTRLNQQKTKGNFSLTHQKKEGNVY